jgi:PAS domain S-box-containing protein/putative nucleotidyltransferase with HDIG domain
MNDQVNVYQTLFDRLPIGLLRIDTGGKIRRVNAALVQFLRYTDKSKLLDQDVRQFFQNPADFDSLLKNLRDNGSAEDFETRLRGSQNQPIWVRIHARSVPDKQAGIFYYEAAVEDITRQRQTYDALRESDHLTKTIIDSVEEGVLVLDRELRFLVWNAYLESQTGLPAREVIGKTANVILERLQIKGCGDHLMHALAGQIIPIEDISYTRPDSASRLWCDVTFSPHRSADGNIVGVVGTFRDITARKEAEREREGLLQKEQGQRLRAEALGRVSKALNAVLDIRPLLEIICKETSELFQVDVSLVWLVERVGQHDKVLEKIAGYGWEHERFTGTQVSLNDMNNLAAQVIHENQPVILNEVSENTRTGLSSVFTVHSIMAVPLTIGEQVIGVLQVIDNHKINRFDPSDVQTATQLAAHTANAINNAQLYDRLQEAHDELEQAYVSTLEGWARALELRDAHTEGHSNRVTDMALRLAKAVGVPTEELEHVRRGSLLHDIGKMAIPDQILEKPGPLTDDEWQVMRQHPVYAHTLLSPIKFLRAAIDIPYCHHERWDGSGYPRGLAGRDIPLAARVFAVVDVFDALTSDRPYRKAWPRDEAIEYIRKESGSHFDPDMVHAFLQIV